MMSSFEKFIHDQDTVIFAGAMGTELQRRGYQTKLPLWSASANEDAPELVYQIHADYFSAGADTCITNTFRTTPRAYAKVGRRHDAHDALKKSVALARKAQHEVSGRPVFLGGSFTTLEDCYRPDLMPSPQELDDEHGQLASWLAAEGVDFLIPETINSLPEAVAMARAASATNIPFIISFVTTPDGKLLDGSPLAEVIQATDVKGRVAVFLNCRPIDILNQSVPVLCSAYAGIKGLYPNGIGHPDDDLGWIFENNDDSIGKFVQACDTWHQAGIKILGGCCGTTPDYIQALSRHFRQTDILAKKSA